VGIRLKSDKNHTKVAAGKDKKIVGREQTGNKMGVVNSRKRLARGVEEARERLERVLKESRKKLKKRRMLILARTPADKLLL